MTEERENDGERETDGGERLAEERETDGGERLMEQRD